ncbi:glycoside hydrolase family 99-like domain-containing protein [Mucilaginibacter sp.]|uniref:glycosyltransferase WbsX family protein n=1 Tax=Mucilaginibacter sp. TaxID=1882438 RepID=UPI00283B9BED|nr:glycoside hydrolase family 99-like domain-containing protein [Mucilaginibacter sp.]MDR3696329.1 glycoside hydrolase family 99-like domain-containing protein [Mucilaginibacter sp.]
MVKVIAVHLPQFHEIPENNEWWGKGFTEWTNTKKCKPIFKGHHQPKEPVDDNYYNLLDKNTLKWQVELAKKYGIYGFCFYHYYFTGKTLLEKPLEIYLANKDIDFPFCFSWANHTWTRTWHESKDILIEQTYGDYKDWQDHFYYLLPFFKDERYIRIENKPTIIFNQPPAFDKANEMIDCWTDLAKQNGLEGIYFIETLSIYQTESVLKKSNALMESEPSYTYHFLPYWYRIFRKTVGFAFPSSKPRLNLYSSFWKVILNRKPIQTDKMVYPGAFVNWDNAARRPVNASIFLFFTSEKFKKHIKKQIIRCKKVYNSEFLFLNAWNEWAEGNYLEPDKKYGYKLLEAIKEALVEAENESV